MNTITTNIILDIESRGILQTLEVTDQDAVCHVVRITPVSGGSAYAISSDVSCALKGTTPAGTTINNAGTKSDYYVDFKISQAMTATAGNYLCELQMTGSNNSRKVVPAFILCVKKDTVDDSTVAASDEYTALSAALSNIADVTAYDTRITNLETAMTTKADVTSLNAYWQTIYPVGSYVILNTTADPNTYLGGTWVKESEGYVLGTAGTSKTVNSTAGSDTHTNTIAEMPAHTHKLQAVAAENIYVRVEASSTYGASAKSTITTDSTGSGSSWDIRQRTKYVYFWKRIA